MIRKASLYSKAPAASKLSSNGERMKSRKIILFQVLQCEARKVANPDYPPECRVGEANLYDPSKSMEVSRSSCILNQDTNG